MSWLICASYLQTESSEYKGPLTLVEIKSAPEGVFQYHTIRDKKSIKFEGSSDTLLYSPTALCATYPETNKQGLCIALSSYSPMEMVKLHG